MIASLVRPSSAGAQGLRPFLPHRDLSDLARLIEVAFGDELAATGSHMVEDLRRMALWGPAWRLAPSIGAMFAGYVWVEDGRVVGNASVMPDRRRGDWTLSNVAVLPAYRGRGIAGKLTDAAIEHVRRRGGRRILLEVRTDNAVAQSLYRHRGFGTYDTVDDLTMGPGRWPVVVGPSQEGIRAPRARDGSALYRLAQASIPASAQRCLPVRAQEWSRGLGDHWRAAWRLALEGEERVEIVAFEGRDLVAYGGARLRSEGGQHTISLLVAPEVRGRWERPIVDALFLRLRHAPRQRIRTQVTHAHREALQALRDVGFEVVRALDEMCLVLDEASPPPRRGRTHGRGR